MRSPDTLVECRGGLGRRSAKVDLPLTQDIHGLLIQSVVDYAIFMLDPAGRVVSWNPGAEHIKGYSANEIIGAHFRHFYTPEDRAAGVPERALKTAAEAGRFSAEGWRVRKGGARFWAMVVIDPVYQDGRLIGFAKITRDMTEQHDAQLAQMESERRFRLLVQGVTDYAIYMLDPDGTVSNWNAGAERIKGYTEAEILGAHVSVFYTPEDRAAGVPWRALEEARKNGRFEAEGWRVRKDGSRFWASSLIDAIHDADGRLLGFAKIIRDLTDRRNAQLQLEQSREQLFQAQKMEAVGQLTGGLAHDFNNLLLGITGSLELMQTRLAQGRYQDLGRFITLAQGAAARAAALTHRLLSFARRQTLQPRPTLANELLAAMEDLLQRTVGPAITFQHRFNASLWPTLCDPNQLENAVLNICINARDAMPDGGRLTIETENVTLDEREARSRDIRGGDYVSIAISDTGCGMSPDVLAHAFDPFFTTKPIGQGTGLGLSMVYGFARQSNGYAQLRSDIGTGTTVSIVLPRHSGQIEEDDTAARTGGHFGSMATHGETILMVGDEPSVRALLAKLLEERGYTVIEAADSTAGLRLLQSNVRIDLLITDVGLPGGLNGRQMAEAGRQLRPGLKVLLVTGYTENAVVEHRRLEPGMHLLLKPFAVDGLAARVDLILREDFSG